MANNFIKIYKTKKPYTIILYCNCDWFKNEDYFIIEDNGYQISFKKCYLNVPKKHYTFSKKTHSFNIMSIAPTGVYELYFEDNNEDIAYIDYK